jgi:ABC-type sulfate transport system permease component
LAISLGGILAWLVTRSDLRWKAFISVVFIFPYILPSWTLAMAWLNFFRNPLVGGAPGLFTALTGIETADWFAYGMLPIIVVQGLHYMPFAYILIGGILRNMDANLEEAATLLQASRLKILTRITLADRDAGGAVHLLAGVFELFELLCCAGISGHTGAVPGAQHPAVPHAQRHQSRVTVTSLHF